MTPRETEQWRFYADMADARLDEAARYLDLMVDLRPERELEPDRYKMEYKDRPPRWIDYMRVAYDPSKMKSVRGRVKAIRRELDRLT